MYRILIADDEEIIRNGLKSLVEQSELDIRVAALAADGRQALEMAQAYAPEIILMDINMPEMNGLEAVERIHAFHEDAKIIVISGYDSFEYAQRALHLGVFDYLLKPINFRTFHTVLQRAMDAYGRRMAERAQLPVQPAPTQALTLNVIDYIRANLGDPGLSLGAAADIFHISQSYMTRLVKQRTGVPFNDFLRQQRIELAKRLLIESGEEKSILEISELTGHASQHYFSRSFRNMTGMSPSQYREAYRKRR